ncbi:hypothetical protein F1188_16310 [Roseospira marina]|uniref:Uncharacterized protein n=1 Tax=Roseospira marina TaxID=140057 RepID=A0A5M6I8A7_9PROT|nr:hypothetical protein [Roseospira marina]KAA5604421.1 hypothetical protein F1188_16310 [Roseospira marina]MBB4315382.1 DNA-binding MarR family transcriptional regulator [Roseospira marina]MBB5088473.1 DNA-binding MarR family transcriptional regulator [Roseospira marina]
MSRLALTPKQREIMKCVLEATDAGEVLTIRGLKEKMSYGPDVTLQAIQSSIRYLEQHGVLVRSYEKIFSRRQVIVKPTLSGYRIFR